MKKPRQNPVRQRLTDNEIEKAQYVGSPEHKVERWWGGLPQAWQGPDGKASRLKKQQTSVCHKVTAEEREQATEWVQEALTLGNVRYFDGDDLYPSRIWYKDSDDKWWMGFCINTTLGHYKGWPADDGDINALRGKLDRKCDERSA